MMGAPLEAVDEHLKTWATEAQEKYIDAVNEHGSMRAAARALGVNYTTVLQAIRAVKRVAARKGYSPGEDARGQAPDGFEVRGKSTLYDREGKIAAQWVKTSADAEARERIIRDAFDAMAEELPRLAPSERPAHTSGVLCNVFTLTDSHVGALCWGQEGGADWDLKIAERVLTGCFEHMVCAAPAAGTAVVAQLGDFMHQDGMQPVTPTSGHILDADGRFSKVVQVAVRLLRRVVDFALSRHDRVVVLMAEGNHDISSSIWLRTMFKALYENEPRVEVIDSPLPYYVYQHGKTMLAWHHGHLKKNDQLPILFASQFAQVWGATTKRYAHCGHRHHVEEKEHSGMVVIQHPTLTARDAYAARGGWIAERQATAITYHREFGQVSRNTVIPEMIQ
jgi:hypothetical protein